MNAVDYYGGALPADSEPDPVIELSKLDEEPMMMLGGEFVSLSRYQAHMGAPVVDPVQIVPAPAAAGASSIGAAGLTVQPSIPDPGALSDDERKLVWAARLGLIKLPSLPTDTPDPGAASATA